MLNRDPAKLRIAARDWITDNLPEVLASEIGMPAELNAEIQRVLGPRQTVFSAAGWGWVNATMTEAREAQLQASLRRGLADSAAGRTTDLGDFTQYAGDLPEEFVIDDDGPLAGVVRPATPGDYDLARFDSADRSAAGDGGWSTRIERVNDRIINDMDAPNA